MNLNTKHILYRQTCDEGEFLTLSEKPDFPLAQVHQTHSADVIEVGENKAYSEADGMIDQSKSCVLAIKTADCLPIYLASQKGNILVHAGWRGLASEILAHPKIIEAKPYFALIGPCIHREQFEVSADFCENFATNKFMSSDGGRHRFDLVALAKTQLTQLFQDVRVQESGHCTFLGRQFHSYRRNKTVKRNWNIFLPSRILAQVNNL